jgi:hypothetical protein
VSVADLDRPLCGVVIVNWCNATDTIACYRSLRQSTYPHLYIVVVENASPDGSFAALSDALSDDGGSAAGVKLLRTERNLGYAGANNRGIRECLRSGCEFVVILNNDTLIMPAAVAALVAVARRDPRAGLVGACLVDYDAPDKLQCLGGGAFNPWLLRTRNIAMGLSRAELSRRPESLFSDADYISGACVLVQRDFVEDVGLMREDLFLYFEEVDWAIRARRAGWGQAVSREAIVRHRATTDEPEKQQTANYYFVRNGLMLLRAYYPVALIFALMSQVVRSLLLNVIGRGRDARAVRRGLWSFIRGRTGELSP